MSEVKWIKITTDMFEDEKIDFIESLPESDAIIVMWVRLLTLAGKCNSDGFIFLTENIPYTEEMLSHKFRKPINTIRLAISTFVKLGMIEDTKKGLYLTNWEKHQNIEGLEKIREQSRLRKQKQRNKEKLLLPLNDNVTRDVTLNVTHNHATELDKELDIDKDIECKTIDEKKKEVSKVKPYTHEFEEFYELYPNGFNKTQTFKSWKTLLKNETIENIMLATKNYIRFIADNNTEKRYLVRSTNFVGQHQEYMGYLDYKQVQGIKTNKVEHQF